jgi:hypothetical protein
MKHQYFIIPILVFTLFLGCLKVEAADDCDYAEQNRLNALASNVKANYSVSEEPEVYFTININNLTSEIYASVKGSEDKGFKNYEYSEANKGNITFTSSEIYQKLDFTIKIYAVNPFCDRSELRTIVVTTPRYNPYYNYAICQDAREFYLCQKWSDFEISYDELVNRVNDYKASLKDDDPKEDDEEKVNIVKVAIDFVVKYYIYFVIGAGTVVVVVSVILIIKRKKRVL